MNIADVLRLRAADRATHTAVEDGDDVVTYADLWSRVEVVAGNLTMSGVDRENLVGVVLPDSIDHIVVHYALAKLGAVCVPISGRSPPAEKSRAVEGLEIVAAIASSESEALPDSRPLLVADLCRSGPRKGSRTTPSIQGEDLPLLIARSSGTTGMPKRLLISHGQLHGRSMAQRKFVGLTSTDRCFLAPGVSLAGRRQCHTMFWLGGTVVLRSGASLLEYPDLFDRRSITFAVLVSSALGPLLASLDGPEPLLPKLKLMISGTRAAPELRLLARRKLTPTVIDVYGTNEVGTLSVASPRDQDIHPESVGRLVEGVEAQVVDAGDRPIGANEVGLVGFRGPRFPTSYFESVDSERSFRDGWFYPGDLASVNEEGYVFLKGRADDVINISGTMVYPAEIENVLSGHPAILDVAVVGWPDELNGEVPVAFVTASDPTIGAELENYCRARLSLFKVPMHIALVAELPKNEAGKVMKSPLREGLKNILREKEV